MKNTFPTQLMIIALVVWMLASCGSAAPATAPVNAADPISTDVQAAPTKSSGSTAENPAGMANPASVYCEERGYKTEIRTAADGSQAGVCIFPDGSECDEWAFFRGECSPFGSASTTEPPAPSPVLEIVPQVISLPGGVLLNPLAEPSLSLYNLDGDSIGAWVTTQPAPISGVHIAGLVPTDVTDVPLVFAATENSATGLKVSQAGKISDLLDFPSGVTFTGLIGAPGSPWVAYTVIEPQQDGSSLVSKLFVGIYDQLTTEPPVLVVENKESRILKLVALRMEESAPQGAWYTYTLFGIGGDSFTAPHAGLYYLDLATGSTQEFLGLDQRFSSLSPDQTWVAWTSDLPDAAMTLTDLADGESVTISPLENYERGAVHALISPDNATIAWMEGRGNAFDGTLQAILRVGTSDGKVIGEYPDEAFATSSGLSDGGTIQPVGWLDNETLLVQTYLPGKEANGIIMSLDVITGEITSMASGIFVEFAYP